MPTPQQTYQSLHPQLTALADEISAQARPRSHVPAAPLVLRIAHRLLRQVRVLVGAANASQIPTLPKQGEVTLGELSASLGQARAALEAFAAANGLDEKPAPAPSREMLALRKKLIRRIDELREGRL